MRNGAVGQLAASPVVIPGVEEIVVRWGDGHRSRYRLRWLRDCCPCERCSGDGSGWRRADLRSVPCDPRPESATIVGSALVLHWEDEDHVSRFDLRWLQDHCCCPTHLDRRRDGDRPVVASGTTRADRPAGTSGVAAGSAATSRPAPMAWSAVADDDYALATWLATVVTDGWAHLTDVPDDDAGLLAVVARFGYVRETNDGRVFDVPADGGDGPLRSVDPYRRPAPSLQLLQRRAGPTDRDAHQPGGGTTLVDGFSIADVLRAERPEAFAQLATWPVQWRYADETVDLVAEAPVVGLGPGGAVVSIRFDERSRVPLHLDPDVVDRHLLALRRFATILDRPQLQVRLTLDPGDVILLDGRRMLHGRTGEEGAALRGCFTDRDALDSRLTVLRRGSAGPAATRSTPGRAMLPDQMSTASVSPSPVSPSPVSPSPVSPSPESPGRVSPDPKRSGSPGRVRRVAIGR